MSAPNRRRPGTASPIKLVPSVEEVHTAPAIDEPSVVRTAPEQGSKREDTLTPVESSERDEKRAVTFSLRTSLKKRAETAVLQTAGHSGGYASMTALVEGAIERELARLSIEFNGGEPFLQNQGGFRQGRPLGS